MSPWDCRYGGPAAGAARRHGTRSDANFENGVLLVTVPKTEQRSGRRKIEIGGGRRTIEGRAEPSQMDPQTGGE